MSAPPFSSTLARIRTRRTSTACVPLRSVGYCLSRGSGRLRGGFVGVDVFFVISGFLISGIILKALSRATFSFTRFLRAPDPPHLPGSDPGVVRPGLGWLTPARRSRSADEAHRRGLRFRLEPRFSTRRRATSIRARRLKPLLHLWSLGVEEQFYFVWPLLLFVTYRWRRVQLPAMIGLACASFAFNLATVRTHPEMAFYMPHARLWELALGGILAHLQLTSPRLPPPAARGATSARYGNLAAVTGLALLCVSFVALRSQQLFPGWFALAPVLGTLLLIAAGERAWINQPPAPLRGAHSLPPHSHSRVIDTCLA